jgi:hypothetical protein
MAGSSRAGRLKPCRRALRAERALPLGVFGPRLARPLIRLASRLASPIIFVPPYPIVHVLFYAKQLRLARKIFVQEPA